jgi:hypothetical protein
VTSIGQNAFLDCGALNSVKVNWTTPLTIPANTFGGVNQAACNLLVPAGSVASYQAAPVWQNFMVSGFISIPTTEIKPAFWNATLAALTTDITATTSAGAQMYRFEVSNGATVVGTYDISSATPNNFALAKISGITYSSTYSIRVALKIGGTWGDYGNAHNVTTPALSATTIQTTKITSTFCGTTLATLDTKIAANVIQNATGYRFEITTGGVTTVYDSSTYNFTLFQTGATVAYGTSYAIRVAAKVNGVYGNYGASCTVTTPTLVTNNVPTTTIQPSFCGATLAALNTKIGAVPVYGATKGRYEVTIAGGSPVVYEVAASNFMLSQTGVAVLYSTNYSIRVAAFVGGVWGNYGASCTVTTPAAPIQYTAIPDPVFEARLISLGLDSGAIDHKVITANIASVTDLSVGDSTVSNLTGIRDFTSLQTLNCFNSNLTALDVSGLTNLQFISSYQDYSLTNVNLAGCTALNSINFGGCPLTSISFAGLTAMSQIDMNSFSISEIDLSSCHNLTYIQIYSDALHKLNLSGLTNMSNLQMYLGGGNLTCIQVDNVATAEQLSLDSSGMGMAQWYKPAGASYSTNCGFTQLLKLSKTNNSFAVKAYPNPFETAFNLNLETPNKEEVTIAVYDMMGKLVETHQVNPTEVANLQIGSNFAAGIYNVIVSQANEMQVLRLIRE